MNATQTKISQFDMAFIRQQHVVWFHITMNDAMPRGT